MRQMTWLSVCVLAAVLLGGCGNSKSESTRRLSRAIDEAQRLYASAATLEGQAQILDLTKQPPQLPSPEKKLTPGKVASASQPVDDKRITDALDSAAKKLKDVLAAEQSAPDGVKADANLLLGQVEQSAAHHYVMQAMGRRLQADFAARQAALLAQGAAGRADLAELPQAIAKASSSQASPMQEIEAMRQSAQQDVDAGASESQKIQEQVKALDEQNQTLVQQNEGLVAQAASLRDKGEAAGGPQGLEMLTQAAKIEHTITANSSQVAANQQEAKGLLGELQSLTERLASDKTRLESVLEFQKKVKEEGGKMDEAAKAFADEAAKEFAEAAKSADEAAALLKQAGDYEKKAETNLQDAITRLGTAEKLGKAEMADATKAMQSKPGVKDEILTALTDEQHVATVTATKADAEMSLADLYSRQLEAGRAYAALAKALSDVAERVKQPAPAAVSALQQSAKDPAALGKSAETSYATAEKDLEGVVKSGLRNSPAKTTLWIFQGMLARAYAGHYQLNHDQALLDKANENVNKAAEGKEFSPYVAPVIQLRQVLNEAGPGGAASKPAAGATQPAAGASQPASKPAK